MQLDLQIPDYDEDIWIRTCIYGYIEIIQKYLVLLKPQASFNRWSLIQAFDILINQENHKESECEKNILIGVAEKAITK